MVESKIAGALALVVGAAQPKSEVRSVAVFNGTDPHRHAPSFPFCVHLRACIRGHVRLFPDAGGRDERGAFPEVRMADMIQMTHPTDPAHKVTPMDRTAFENHYKLQGWVEADAKTIAEAERADLAEAIGVDVKDLPKDAVPRSSSARSSGEGA